MDTKTSFPAPEVCAYEAVAEIAQSNGLRELQSIELALVGGGQGDIVVL